MADISMSDKELLQFAIQNGMIDTALVQEKIEMLKKKEILKKHPYKIWEGKDGYWHTYLPKEDGGRKPVKKKEQKDIEDIVVKYWAAHSSDERGFKARFDVWVERQRIRNRSGNTISRYISDYDKCFAGYPIESKLITAITDEDIYKHLKTVIEKENITYKRVKSLFGYIKGVFEKSILDKLMTVVDNPCQYVDIETLKPLCRKERSHTVKERTISPKETEILLNKMHKPNYRNKHANVVAYKAIELAMLTGMRVGELSGLMWRDIDYEEGVLIIRHSEKYDRSTKEYSIEATKNEKVRYFPITDDIKRVFEETRKLEEANGWLGEFVFMNKNGRVHCRVISACMRNLTLSKEYEHSKSIHAIRRTVNSKMRCNGVSAQVAASLIGNTKEVNENHYSYNVEEYEKQKSYVENAKLI